MARNCLPPDSHGFAIEIAANAAERQNSRTTWHKKVVVSTGRRNTLS